MANINTVRKMNAEEKKFMSVMKTRATFEVSGYQPLNFATMSAKIVAAPGLGTMACDSKWRVYIDFDYWMSKAESVESSTNAFMHEINHLLRGHFDRFAAVSSMDSDTVNVATDIEINNSVFVRMRALRPAFEIHTAELYGFDDFLTAEDYFNLLKENGLPEKSKDDSSEDGEGEGQGGEGSGDDDPQSCGGGSGAGGKPLDIEAQADEFEPGLNDIQSAVVRENVARDVIEADKKSRGSVPSDLLRWAEIELAPPEVDWRTKLGSPIQSIIMSAKIHMRKNWARPSRRQSPSRDKIIVPSKHGPKPVVCYISDTSMSMGTGEGSRVATEMDAILSDQRINVVAISADAAVSEIQEDVRSISDIKFTGGGGTDMRIPLQRAKELHRNKRFSHTIVATDGGTPWPTEEEEFPFKIIALIIDNGSAQSPIPSYIEVINVPKGM